MTIDRLIGLDIEHFALALQSARIVFDDASGLVQGRGGVVLGLGYLVRPWDGDPSHPFSAAAPAPRGARRGRYAAWLWGVAGSDPRLQGWVFDRWLDTWGDVEALAVTLRPVGVYKIAMRYSVERIRAMGDT